MEKGNEPPALGLGREQDEVAIGKIGAGGGSQPSDAGLKPACDHEGKTGHCTEGITHKLHDGGCCVEDSSCESESDCSK